MLNKKTSQNPKKPRFPSSPKRRNSGEGAQAPRPSVPIFWDHIPLFEGTRRVLARSGLYRSGALHTLEITICSNDTKRLEHKNKSTLLKTQILPPKGTRLETLNSFNTNLQPKIPAWRSMISHIYIYRERESAVYSHPLKSP